MPNFSAIDLIAAHSDGYSLRCSNTMRTARSRISAGYLPGLLIAPSSQGMESPRFPGRFTAADQPGEILERFVRAVGPPTPVCVAIPELPLTQGSPCANRGAREFKLRLTHQAFNAELVDLSRAQGLRPVKCARTPSVRAPVCISTGGGEG